MVWLALIIPILTCLFLLLFTSKRVVVWEYLIILIPSLFLVTSLKYIFIECQTSDTEYLGYGVTEARYYEAWDEWITKECSYKTCTGSGKDEVCTTHYYDCSYRDYHPEYWVLVANGDEYNISQTYYNYLCQKFKTPKVFQELNRDYYTQDGNMYATTWGGQIEQAEAITISHTYENKVQAAHSIFKIEDLSPEEVKKLKLFEYPRINDYQQNCVLGYSLTEQEKNKLAYLNGSLASKIQLRAYILVFKNKGLEIAYKQRSHWEGGNKNELVICIGIDSLTNQVQWVKSFSWMETPTLSTEIESIINEQKTLNINTILDQLILKAPIDWKRRPFKDFNYLQIEVTGTQLTILIILVIILNIGLSIYVITNEFIND